jgi:hypothetical protein
MTRQNGVEVVDLHQRSGTVAWDLRAAEIAASVDERRASLENASSIK